MKTVIITGAGKGIGFETTKNILNEFHDTKVIAISRNVVQLEKIESKNLQIIKADLVTQFEFVLSEIGNQKIDGLLNNAAVLIKKNIHQLTYKDFEDIYRINVFVPFNLSTRLSKQFNKSAHIVNIGSMGGFENSIKFPEMLFYSSSKAALHCLSQCLSVEFKDLDIKVNCLSIGSAETEMVKIAFPSYTPPISGKSISKFISWFLFNGQIYFNGQIIPVALESV